MFGMFAVHAMGTKLKKLLQGILPEDELCQVVGSFDIVGDIAIVIIPPTLTHREFLIGETILKSNGRIKVVAKRAGMYEGEFRTIPLQIIAGEQREETVVREFGLSYVVNPGTVYFSVRSGNERRRIASLVGAKEKVLVLFSGVAPYPLVISKYSSAELIVGIEKNPIAHNYGMKNLKLNKKFQNIRLFCGDVREVLHGVGIKFDRVVMPLPKGGELFLPDAIHGLHTGGTIHFYHMQQDGCFDQSVSLLEQACIREKRRLQAVEVHRCGHCSPRVYRICIDGVLCTLQNS